MTLLRFQDGKIRVLGVEFERTKRYTVVAEDAYDGIGNGNTAAQIVVKQPLTHARTNYDSMLTLDQRLDYTVRASGTATAGSSSTTMNDTGVDFTTMGIVTGDVADTLVITGGTGSGQERRIKTVAATTLTIEGAWTTTPDATSTYEIRKQDFFQSSALRVIHNGTTDRQLGIHGINLGAGDWAFISVVGLNQDAKSQENGSRGGTGVAIDVHETSWGGAARQTKIHGRDNVGIFLYTQFAVANSNVFLSSGDDGTLVVPSSPDQGGGRLAWLKVHTVPSTWSGGSWSPPTYGGSTPNGARLYANPLIIDNLLGGDPLVSDATTIGGKLGAATSGNYRDLWKAGTIQDAIVINSAYNGAGIRFREMRHNRNFTMRVMREDYLGAEAVNAQLRISKSTFDSLVGTATNYRVDTHYMSFDFDSTRIYVHQPMTVLERITYQFSRITLPTLDGSSQFFVAYSTDDSDLIYGHERLGTNNYNFHVRGTISISSSHVGSPNGAATSLPALKGTGFGPTTGPVGWIRIRVEGADYYVPAYQ